MDSRLREHSRIIVDGPSRAPARSYFRAVGLTDDDLAKPLVGVANTWIEAMPCKSGRPAELRWNSILSRLATVNPWARKA